MAKRLFDLTLATLGLALTAPLIAIAALGIRLSGPGPIIYRARRIGGGGRTFTMFKFRTMHATHAGRRSRITTADDPRVFPFGRLLRYTKIDELPQLINVLRGEMSIVGPRPEDPEFVLKHYAPEHRETLRARPGLASPGSLYHDTHGGHILLGGDPEQRYLEQLLPLKLALDLVYVRRASLRYDLAIILRVLATIVCKVVGRPIASEPPEMAAARGLLTPARRAAPRSFTAAALLLATALAAPACRGEPSAASFDLRVDLADAEVLVGAGDIGRCDGDVDEATAALLDSIPGTIFTTGDNAYPDGSATDFADCYAPSWGRHRDRTRPAPGNHDYHTEGAAAYYAYFGPAAGPPGRGYYSYDLGSWHIIVLNSEIDVDPTSEQLAWLRADLAANPTKCTLAYWHRPLFSSGSTNSGFPDVLPLWNELYAAGAEIILNGHEHNYERFAPQTPSGETDRRYGIRQFVVGTGGSSGYRFGRTAPNSRVRQAGTPGVLLIWLLPSRYEWQFVPVAGKEFTDDGGDICHDPPPGSRATTAAAPVMATEAAVRARDAEACNRQRARSPSVSVGESGGDRCH